MFMISHVNVVETFEGKHLVIYYKHCVKRLTHSILLTHFNPMLSFSTPETSENQSFSDAFMGYRNGTLGQNGLRKTKGLCSPVFRSNWSLTDIYQLKVSDNDARKRCEICSKWTIKTPEQRQWRRSGVFIGNYERIS